MTTAVIREKLHEYIEEADDQKIEAIYTLLEGQLTSKWEWSEDEEFMAELDERVRRYEAGIDEACNWDELEKSIAELKKKRVSK